MKYLREYSIIIKQIYGIHNVKNIAISMITRINYGIMKLIRIITKTKTKTYVAHHVVQL